VLIPQLFWFRGVRRQLLFVFVISVLVNVGMWLERFVIIVTSLERDFLPSSWAGYMPTLVEIATLLGSFGLFFTCFLLFCRLLPIIAMAEVKAVVSGESSIPPSPPTTHRPPVTTPTGAKVILATFATEEHLLDAVRAACSRNLPIADVYAPYPVHGLEELLGWRRSRVSAACLLGGLIGVGLALWFQFWTTAQDWPINVGGRPWNSLPAFVPVTFECMVLFASFGLVIAWLYRSGLHPGSDAIPPAVGLTDDRFALAVYDQGNAAANEIRQFMSECQALSLEERLEE
jgi:hypothetical protein